MIINKGVWEIAKDDKVCDGCQSPINKGDQYMLCKFTVPQQPNLIKLHSLYLCDECVTQFEQSIQDMPNDTV